MFLYETTVAASQLVCSSFVSNDESHTGILLLYISYLCFLTYSQSPCHFLLVNELTTTSLG
jgi:hypothetical protein